MGLIDAFRYGLCRKTEFFESASKQKNYCWNKKPLKCVVLFENEAQKIGKHGKQVLT